MAHHSHQLGTLRKVREATRDERRRRLAEALQAEAVLDTRRSEILQQEADLLETRRYAALPHNRSQNQAEPVSRPSGTEAADGSGIGIKGFDLNQIVNAQRYQMVLDAEKAVLEDQRTALAGEIDRRRLALVQADQEVRAVERLEQKQDAAERSEQACRENRELDEAALQMHLRHRM